MMAHGDGTMLALLNSVARFWLWPGQEAEFSSSELN
jgi:hypothetical protein